MENYKDHKINHYMSHMEDKRHRDNPLGIKVANKKSHINNIHDKVKEEGMNAQ